MTQLWKDFLQRSFKGRVEVSEKYITKQYFGSICADGQVRASYLRSHVDVQLLEWDLVGTSHGE